MKIVKEIKANFLRGSGGHNHVFCLHIKKCHSLLLYIQELDLIFTDLKSFFFTIVTSIGRIDQATSYIKQPM